MATIATQLAKSLVRQAGESWRGRWTTRNSKLNPGFVSLQNRFDKLPVELVQKIWNELVPLLMWRADWKKVLRSKYLKEYKTIVLGSQGAGKSNFVIRYVQDQFCEFFLAFVGLHFETDTNISGIQITGDEYDPTLEDSYRKIDLVDGHWCIVDILDGGDWELEWRYGHILRYPDCILLMFSLTSRKSFTTDLPYWVDEVTKHRGMVSNGTPPPSDGLPCQIVLVGTKSDDIENRCVHRDEAEAYAAKLNVAYFECSAKSREGITEAVHQLVRKMLEYDKANGWKVSKRNADG